MIRVVADTNVYVSALLFGGAPEEVLLLAQAGTFSLYISPAIREELSRVLAQKFGWEQTRVRAALSAIAGFTIEAIPNTSVNAVAEDAADNRILECALAAQAHVIVSGDQHLRRLRRFRHIPILTPREFLGELPKWQK